MKNINKKKISDFFKENYMIFIIFFLLMLFIIQLIPAYGSYSENDYSFLFYQLNYERGFISRGFIGTIFKIIFKVVTYKKIYYTTLFLITLFIGFISYLINKLIKRYNKSLFILLVSILFIINPSSFIQMFMHTEYGRFDYFLFFNAIVSIILIYKNKHLFLIPFISLISVFIHQNYIIIYAPLICSLLLYEGISHKDKKQLKYLTINILVLLFSIIIVYTFGKNTGFLSYEEHLQAITLAADYPMDAGALYWEFYQDLLTGIKLILPKAFVNQGIVNYIYAIFSLILYLFVFVKICFKKVITKLNKKSTFLTILVLISPLSVLLLFFIGADYGRWFTSIINLYTILCFYVMYKNSDIIIEKSNKNELVVLLIAIMFFAIMFQETIFCYLTFDKINYIVNYIRQFFLVLLNLGG